MQYDFEDKYDFEESKRMNVQFFVLYIFANYRIFADQKLWLIGGVLFECKH